MNPTIKTKIGAGGIALFGLFLAILPVYFILALMNKNDAGFFDIAWRVVALMIFMLPFCLPGLVNINFYKKLLNLKKSAYVWVFILNILYILIIKVWDGFGHLTDLSLWESLILLVPIISLIFLALDYRAFFPKKI